jgi:hypothetical protein
MSPARAIRVGPRESFVGRERQEKRKQFFFEKKNQKTSIRWRVCTGDGPSSRRAARRKFFGSFFQKRTAFFFGLT